MHSFVDAKYSHLKMTYILTMISLTYQIFKNSKIPFSGEQEKLLFSTFQFKMDLPAHILSLIAYPLLPQLKFPVIAQLLLKLYGIICHVFYAYVLYAKELSILHVPLVMGN